MTRLLTIPNIGPQEWEDQILKENRLALVEFWLPWSPLCKKLSFVVESLSDEYKDRVRFATLDVEEAQDIAEQYGVRAIPTLKFFFQGKAAGEISGYVSRKLLKAEIDKTLQTWKGRAERPSPTTRSRKPPKMDVTGLEATLKKQLPDGEIKLLVVGTWLWVQSRLHKEWSEWDATTDRSSGDPQEEHEWRDWIGPAATAPAKVSGPEDLYDWALFRASYTRRNRDVGWWGTHEGRWVENVSKDGWMTVRTAEGKYEDVSPDSLATTERVQIPHSREKSLDKILEEGKTSSGVEALKAFDEALSIDPNNASAWYNKGVELREMGRNEDALRAYDEVIRLDPKNAKAWHDKGGSLRELGMYEEAMKTYDEAVRLNPKDAKAWDNKGWTLNRLGRYEDALKAYDEAIGIDPKYTLARHNKGVTLQELGRYEDALKSYDEAGDFRIWYEGGVDKQGDAMAWYNKGVILQRLGRNQKALKAYVEAIEIDSDILKDSKNALAWYAKGFVLARGTHYEDALKAYDEAIRIDPNHRAGYAKAWLNKGVSLQHLGRYEEALEAYDEAIRLNPKNVQKLGRFEDAVKAYEKSRGIDHKDRGYRAFRDALAKLLSQEPPR